MGRIPDLQHWWVTYDCQVTLDYETFAQRTNEIYAAYDILKVLATEPFPGLCYCCKDKRPDARDRPDFP